MDLTQNYFELFGLTQGFTIDDHSLSDRYRELQKQLHPDNFANKSVSEQRLAVQFTSLLNSAYQTLKCPLLRAEYLLELRNHPFPKEALTIKSDEFLLKQMEWRESLADLADVIKLPNISCEETQKQLDELSCEVTSEISLLEQEFHNYYQQEQFDKALEMIAKWHFIEKVRVAIEDLEDKLFD